MHANQTEGRPEGRRYSWVWWLLGLAAIVLVLLFILSATQNQTGITQQNGQTPTIPATGDGQVATASVSEIIGNPSLFEGATVSVPGTVERVIGSRGAVISGTGAGGDQMLVIMPSGQNLSEGDEVTVTGMARMLTQTEAEREVGQTLDATTQNLVTEQPILLAESVSQSGSSGLF